MLQPKQTPKEKKNTKDATQMKNMRPVFKGPNSKLPQPKNLSGTAKSGKTISKAKNGKSFPDLNKDGKITKADILKGRGVIAKKGMSVKKAQDGDYLDSTELIPRAGAMLKTKVKERSPDGNYIKKTVTKTKKGATSKSTKTRRTLQGYLDGAPRVSQLKSGGSMKKCKYGCK